MPVIYKKTVAGFEAECGVEDAEPLLEWLQEHPKARINLKDATHVHSAVLQVLMAMSPAISVPPQNKVLAKWLLPAIERQGKAQPG